MWDPSTPYARNAAAWRNTVESTSRRQLEALSSLQTTIRKSTDLRKRSLPSAILAHLDARSRSSTPAWLPQTYFREMMNLEGAFKTLGKFSTNLDISIKLPESAEWRTAKTAWDRLSRQHQPVDQAAASPTDIQLAIDLAPEEEMRIFLALLWISAARKGDVANLSPSDVQFDAATGRITLFIQQGKGTYARKSKYRIPTHAPLIWRPMIADFLSSRSAEKRLFSRHLASQRDALDALRRANAHMTCRAVRRGAIQTMAKAGASEEAVMKITGHKSRDTYHRYLNWDRDNELPHRQAQEAAMALTVALEQGL